HGLVAEMTLKRELVMFGVRQPVVVEEAGRAANRSQLRPVHIVIRILRAHMQRRKCDREFLPLYAAIRAVHKRCCEIWLSPNVEETEWCVTNLIEVGGTFEGGIKHSPTGSNTRFAGAAGQSAEKAA